MNNASFISMDEIYHRVGLTWYLEYMYPADIYGPEEHAFKIEILNFLHENRYPFFKDNSVGHIVASALILSPDYSSCALIYHRKLKMWLQPGGHLEKMSDTSLLNAAIREGHEETGLTLTPLYKNVFDIDAHTMPAYRNIPEHKHYDIRFLFIANSYEFNKDPNEIENIKWFKVNDLNASYQDKSLTRVMTKIADYVRLKNACNS